MLLRNIGAAVEQLLKPVTVTESMHAYIAVSYDCMSIPENWYRSCVMQFYQTKEAATTVELCQAHHAMRPRQ